MMQIQVPGSSANQFYKSTNQKYIPLTKFEIILSRFDLVYERINKDNGKITVVKINGLL